VTQAKPTTARPAVEPDEASRPFFDGAAKGLLMIQRCNDCKAWLAPVARLCTECLSESIGWAQASGRGRVHTFGIMHQVYHPGFQSEVPYNITIVELEEGPRLQTNVVGCSNADIRVGMKVQAVFEHASGTVSVPKFRPASP